MTDDTHPRPMMRRRQRIYPVSAPADMRQALPPGFQPPPTDAIDAEIDAALAANRPVNFAAAFPDPLPPVQPVAPPAPPPAAAPTPAPNYAPPPPPPPSDDGMGDSVPTGADENMNPAQRLRYVGTVAPSYLEEYKMQLLARLLLRRLPLDVIASQLGCSVRTVQNMRAKLNKRYTLQAKALNIHNLAEKTLQFYDEIRGAALRMVDTRNTPLKEKQSAMRIAIEAQSESTRFLHASRYFEFHPLVVDSATAAAKIDERTDTTLAMLAHVLRGDTTADNMEDFFESEETEVDPDVADFNAENRF